MQSLGAKYQIIIARGDRANPRLSVAKVSVVASQKVLSPFSRASKAKEVRRILSRM